MVRVDLGMGRGKIAVECCHASVSAAEEARTRFSDWWMRWLKDGQRKIALKMRGLPDLLELEKRSRDLGLPSYLVRDSGLTQVYPGTVTCLGIGPAPSDSVDNLTGNLTLL